MPKRSGCVLVLLAVLNGIITAAPDFEALGRDTVAELAGGAFDKVVARFDEKMAASLPREKLAEAWQTVVDQAGAFKSVTSVAIKEVPTPALHVVVLTSAFEMRPVNIQIAFRDNGSIAGLYFLPVKPPVAAWSPPPYADAATFAETAVTVGALKLPGTLSRPGRPGSIPGVVLVHGSGPLDRDETIGPNKVFKDLAWGLSSRGVAVLRYDKRSLVAPMKSGTVKDEVIDDAVAAVDLLAAEQTVDKARIFVLGHSLGGMLAPRIAEAGKNVGGLIILAGATRPLEEVIVDQIRHLRGPGTPEAQAAEEFARRVRDPKLGADDIVNFMGSPMPAAYWLDLRGYHPGELAARLGKPVFVLQGGRDYQVTLADFEGWKSALGAREQATLKLYAAMNHLFIAGEGRSMPDEYNRAGHVALEVIDDIASWISRN